MNTSSSYSMQAIGYIHEHLRNDTVETAAYQPKPILNCTLKKVVKRLFIHGVVYPIVAVAALVESIASIALLGFTKIFSKTQVVKARLWSNSAIMSFFTTISFFNKFLLQNLPIKEISIRWYLYRRTTKSSIFCWPILRQSDLQNVKLSFALGPRSSQNTPMNFLLYDIFKNEEFEDIQALQEQAGESFYYILEKTVWLYSLGEKRNSPLPWFLNHDEQIDITGLRNLYINDDIKKAVQQRFQSYSSYLEHRERKIKDSNEIGEGVFKEILKIANLMMLGKKQSNRIIRPKSSLTSRLYNRADGSMDKCAFEKALEKINEIYQ